MPFPKRSQRKTGGVRPTPPRDPRPRDNLSHVVAVTGGLLLYLATLWLGVFVIGDTVPRSAVMAGVVVAIAVAGYVFTRQPTRPGR